MDELIATRYENLYQKLITDDMRAQLPGTSSSSNQALSEQDIRKLIMLASMLSTSDETSHRSKAYEICSRLIEVGGEGAAKMYPSVDLIFSRLGNFPGRTLLREFYAPAGGATDPYLPLELALEQITREIENTPSTPGTPSVLLTDFQFDLLGAMDQGTSVSVSAPTSAGKSFVLRLDIVRRLKAGQNSIVYLVPTRALIREVASSIRAILRQSDLGNVPVRTAPFPLAKLDAPYGVVYVLTQERLLTLLNSRDVPTWVSTLIVDEAHNIQDDARGVALETAIESVLRKFPHADVHFASPLSSNPELFLELFGRDGQSLIERQSPVSQNIIYVTEVKNNKRLAISAEKFQK